MEEFKLCSDGEFMPAKLPCPPPYSGPYYYYPYDNIPFPPPAAGSFNNYGSTGGGGGAPISAGAVAGIIILMGLIIVMLCFFAIKFRSRIYGCRSIYLGLSGARSGRNMRDVEAGGDLTSGSSGDVHLLSVVGGGLEEKLVNLLPAYEYVRFQDEGCKERLNVDQKKGEGNSCSTECAVCLSLFEEKDIVRILPKCKHVFHLLCIDKWFESHANCPLCRERITLQTIQLFLENSKDEAATPVNAGHRAQFEEYGACQNESNCGVVDNSLPTCLNLQLAVNSYEDQHNHLLPNQYQNYSLPQQETEASVAYCNGLQESAAGNDDDGPPSITGYHNATKQYQSDCLLERHDTSSLMQKSIYDDDDNDNDDDDDDDDDDQGSFSFPIAHHAGAVGGHDKESPPLVVHAELQEPTKIGSTVID